MKIKPSLTALLLLLTTMTYGQTIVFSDGDFDFTVLENDPTAVKLKALGGTLSGDVVIPESASCQGETYTVREIEDLGDNPNVLSIRIPKTVLSITNDFYNLKGLKNIYVDEDNPDYLSIDGVLYYSFNMGMVEYPQARTGEYRVPEGVLRINNGFHAEIPKIVISSTVKYVSPYIGTYIKEFEVAEGNANYKSINGALCSNDGKILVSYPKTNVSIILIPESIDSIGTDAIRQNKSIILNSSTPPSIGHYSWYDYNTNIAGIYVKSDYLNNYITDAKISCYNLLGYNFIADSILYAKSDDGEVGVVGSYSQSEKTEIPRTVKDESNNFYTVTSIGRKVFYQNSILREVSFPETLKTIGDSAFAYNNNLYELRLPASLTAIGKNAFYGCWNLYYVYVGCAPIDISAGCFSYYRTLYVPSEYEEQYRTAIGWKNFSTILGNDIIYDNFVLKKLTAETVEIINYTGEQTDITIPDEITIDGKNCKVTAIGKGAFESKKLTSVKLPKWLEEIGEYSFRYNYSLKSIDFPNTLKIIRSYAFYNNGLISFSIPSSLENIGDYAFSLNYNLNTIICEGETPCVLGYYPFYNNNNLKILIKPSSVVSTYKIASSWQNYINNIYGVDAIVGDLAYQKIDNQSAAVTCCIKSFNNDDYNRLAIPANVNIENVNHQVSVISESVFYNSYLNELTIPESVDSIGSKAFSYNTIVRMESQTPPKTNNNTFYSYPKKVIVPLASLESYKTALNWQKIKDRIMAYDILKDDVAYLKLDETHVAVCGIISASEKEVLEIPEKIEADNNEYTVSVIGSQAFYNNSGYFLALPQSIDSIAKNASYNNFTLVYLKSTTPPRLGDNNYSTIYVPFSLLEAYQNNTQWVPSSWYKDRIIGTDGIINNDSLIYNINKSAGTAELCFWTKASTESIEVPSTVTLDGSSYSVTSLRERAFDNYYSVKTFKIPGSITSIGNYAIPSSSEMTVISEATIPPILSSDQYYIPTMTLYVSSAAYESYTTADVWKDFGNIIAIDDGDNQFFYAKAGNGKAIVTGVKTATFTEIEIPETTVIDGEQLKVTKIGDKLFMNNRSIQKVKFPNTIEEIGDMAFYGASLQQITIPASVVKIGERALAINPDINTYNYLNKIQVRAGNEKFMDRDENLLLSKDGKRLLQTASSGGEFDTWWGYDENDVYGQQEYNPLDGIETIAAGALDGCQISTIKLPATLKKADATMLMYMPYLSEINVDTLHKELCSVDGVLFSKDTTTVIYFPYGKSYYYEYSNYSLPEKVRNIGKFAFYNSQFESLTLSDSLKTIADSAYYSRYRNYTYTLILVNNDIAMASENSFTDNMYQYTVLYVPMGTQNDYINTSPWSNFRNINSAKLADEDFRLLKAFYEEMDNGEGWYNKWTIGETADETRITRGIRMMDEHVYSIDLSNNGLKGGLSDKLFQLPYLVKLNLSNNQLACPIDSVLNEENIDNYVLEELNISNNKFTGNIGTIGSTLKNLTTLYASYNKLTQVSPMLPPTVDDLDLYRQDLDTIDYKALYNAAAEEVEANQPNLLYYNHQAQSYTSNRKYNMWNIDGDPWYLYLTSNQGNISLSASSTDYQLYKRPNGALFHLSSNNEDGYSAIVKILFEPGDVNFDTEVNVSDLQLTVDYALEQSPSQLYNFTAADVQDDDWVNVQDVVSIVNLLLNQDIAPNQARIARSRALATTENEAEATLFWRGNLLILRSNCDVSAMDIAISDAKDVKWLLNDTDYDYSISKKNGYVRIVHYSMAGKSIKAGETIIAEVSGNAANVLKAELVDKKAKAIKTVCKGSATGIQEMTSSLDVKINANATGFGIHTGQPTSNLQWTVYSLGGHLLGKGTANLSSGSNYVSCNLAGETQVIIQLLNEHVNINKKVSVTK